MKLNPRSLSILVAILAIAIFLLTGGLQALGRLGASQMGATPQLLFNPDDVDSLDWQVASDHIALTREADGWKSCGEAVRPEQVQKALIGLAMASSEHHAFAPFNKVLGSLTMKDGSIRRFKWNGSVFKWTEGPQADTGGLPNLLLQHILESGRYVAAKPHVAWCKTRPKEIRVESETTNFIVRAGEQGSWLRSSLKETEHKIDPTAVEKWLSESCEFDGSFWRDRDLAGQRVQTPATFKFELQDGTKGSWDYDPQTGLINIDGDRAIIAPEWLAALANVARIP